MLALFAFIIVIIGGLNWLCIGFFQFDFVAGLFGTQSSIFSRFIYIVVGIASVFLTYAVIRYKGRLTIKKNENQDKVLMNKESLPQNYNSNTQLINDNNIYANSNNNLNLNQQNLQNSNNENTNNIDNYNGNPNTNTINEQNYNGNNKPSVN